MRSLSHRFKENMKTAFKPLITWRPGAKDLAELLLLAGTLPLYYLVRGQAHQQVNDAVRHGVGIVHLENSLGIFWEVQLQSWVLSYGWLVKLLNWFYLFGHLPVIGTLAIWMYFWHRPPVTAGLPEMVRRTAITLGEEPSPGGSVEPLPWTEWRRLIGEGN